MIYDCFQVANELEVLDIRLHELADVVDKFVLVESTVSHACKPKRLYYNENKERFKKFKNKIIHIVVQDTPNVTLPWIVNDYQFCQMIRGLTHCKQSDTVIFGDLDEIPRAEAVRKWKNKPGGLKVFAQTYSQYYLNFVDYAKGPWYGTRMAKYKDFLTYKTPWIAKFSHPDVIIPDGGWHLTYMGGIKRIREKLANMTHQEYNNNRYNTPEHILSAIYQQKDFLESGYKFRLTTYNFLPEYVQKNEDRFHDLLLDRDTLIQQSLFRSIVLSTRKKVRIGLRSVRSKL